METAAQRYKSVYSSISGIKNIFQIALFIGLWKFYPYLADGAELNDKAMASIGFFDAETFSERGDPVSR